MVAALAGGVHVRRAILVLRKGTRVRAESCIHVVLRVGAKRDGGWCMWVVVVVVGVRLWRTQATEGA